MRLEILGHATLVLYDADGAPLLLTDPWLIGSCYWRSWWLQNAPDEAQIERLRAARYCLVTHEHADHFHMPSIRRLGAGPLYLAPDFPEEQIAAHLRAGGFRAEVIPARTWRSLAPGVSILSLPAANDDSVLLIDTPRAVLINLNDSKPGKAILDGVRRYLDLHAPGKTRVLLSSYSPASLVNSFFSKGERVSLRAKAGYVRYVGAACDRLGAHLFLPFASQAVFRRADSEWANAFKVRYADLAEHWASAARLAPPYASLNLTAPEKPESLSWVNERDYRHDDPSITAKVAEQEQRDAAPPGPEHLRLLERKLSRAVPFLGLIFPRGLSFRSGPSEILYNPWTFRAKLSKRRGSVRFNVPPAIFRDVLETGRFGDLGITMSVTAELNGWGGARRVYVLFFGITLHDYGHTASPAAFLRWIRSAFRSRAAEIPPPA